MTLTPAGLGAMTARAAALPATAPLAAAPLAAAPLVTTARTVTIRAPKLETRGTRSTCCAAAGNGRGRRTRGDRAQQVPAVAAAQVTPVDRACRVVRARGDRPRRGGVAARCRAWPGPGLVCADAGSGRGVAEQVDADGRALGGPCLRRSGRRSAANAARGADRADAGWSRVRAGRHRLAGIQAGRAEVSGGQRDQGWQAGLRSGRRTRRRPDLPARRRGRRRAP